MRRELASADAVDVIVSFVKWNGVRMMQPELARFLERRPGRLRILTTTYMAATDPEAIEELQRLGADVRVSYDSRRTRLHAKAWLFEELAANAVGEQVASAHGEGLVVAHRNLHSFDAATARGHRAARISFVLAAGASLKAAPWPGRIAVGGAFSIAARTERAHAARSFM